MLWTKTIYFENGTKIVRQSVTYARGVESVLHNYSYLTTLTASETERTNCANFLHGQFRAARANSRPSTRKSIDAGRGEALNGNLKIIS